MQTAKMNAAIIPPKLCRDANNIDEINIEKDIGTINFNLFNKTPLNINSSAIGERITIVIKLPKANTELKVLNNINGLKDGINCKMKSDR